MNKLIIHNGVIIERKYNKALYDNWAVAPECYAYLYKDKDNGAVYKTAGTRENTIMIDKTNKDQYPEYII